MSLSADQVSKHVETLHKAMKGMGTNENQLIEVLGTTSAPQMDQIAKSFKAALGKDLLEEIKSETRGNFATLAQDLVTPAAHFDAKCVQSAVQGMGTDEELLIEVIVGRSNAEIAAMKAAYSTIYKQDLEKDVANDLDGKLKRFFVGMVQGQRDESQQVLDINRDVESLFNAGQGKWGTDGILS